MVLLQGFEPFSVQTQAEPVVRIHGLKWANASSSLPPLLLLHGFPQNLHMWHRVAPELVGQYSVILIDIRGYGQSSAPAEVSAYAKSAMARDCIAVMDSLGFTESFYVCSHDRGARVAHKLCVNYPSRVKKVILLDICPTLAMYTKTDFNFASAYYHWFMLIQDEPLPETFLSGPPRPVMELLLTKGRAEARLSIFDQACFDSYVENLRHPATIHAMCNDYRAGAKYDLEEAREDLKNDRLVKCPLLIIWGNRGVIEKCFKATEEWRAVTDASVPVAGYSVESGHFIPEEAPESVLSAIHDFFG